MNYLKKAAHLRSCISSKWHKVILMSLAQKNQIRAVVFKMSILTRKINELINLKNTNNRAFELTEGKFGLLYYTNFTF